MASAPTCPKCQRSMKEGYLLDVGYGSSTPSAWVEDPPIKSFWLGVRLHGRKPIPIVSYRCTGCGYLENYAK